MVAKISSSIGLWFRIIRPQTLFASLCPVVMGLLVVGHSGLELNTIVAVLTLLCALALQILSNLINDLYDFLRGTDQKGRAGFKRALAEGEVSLYQMRWACGITLAVVVFSGLFLVIHGGWPILLIGLSAILFAWLYTATSHSLSYLGIADVFVYLYYGVVATMGTIWLQISLYDSTTSSALMNGFWAGSVCGICSMCVLMINNLRDMEGDRLAGKKTFPVRFGKRAGESMMLVLVLFSPLCAWLAWHHWLPCLVVLPLLFLWKRVLHAEGAKYNPCLMLAGICNLIYVVLVVCAEYMC